MKANLINKIIFFCVTMLSTFILNSCEDEDTVEDMKVQDVKVTNITGTTAKIAIECTNDHIYAKYPESCRMYYGTSPDVREMKDFVFGIKDIEAESHISSDLAFYLNGLKENTQYWFALKMDTIYANYQNDLRLVNNQGYNGYLIPANNTFTTSKAITTVDLGLSVLWAQCDLGSEEVWLSTKYNWSVTEYRNGQKPTSVNIAGTADDNATVILGEEWHTPTVREFRELIDNCDWEIKKNPQWGAFMRFTSRINGNYIDMYPNTIEASEDWKATFWTANVSDLGASDSSFDTYQFNFSYKHNNSSDWFDSVSYSTWRTAQIRPVKKK